MEWVIQQERGFGGREIQPVVEALAEATASHPECEMTVRRGHTHSAGVVRVLPTLRVMTGAEYSMPEVQRVMAVLRVGARRASPTRRAPSPAYHS